MKYQFIFLAIAIIMLYLFFACGKKTKTLQTSKNVEEITEAKAEVVVETKPEITTPEVLEPKGELEEEPQSKLESKPEEISPWVLASIRKTSCFGKCPVFEFRIFSDGRLEYDGKRFVDMEGLYEAKAPEGMLEAIMAEAQKSGYMNLADNYPTNGARIPDLPSTYTSLTFENSEKKIRNNHNAPKALIAFEKFLASWIEKVAWKKIERR